MVAKVVLSCVIATLGFAVLAPSSLAAPKSEPSASVQIVTRPATLGADGGVQVVIASKCASTLQAFELDVNVDQPNASGFIFRLAPPAVVLCDGTKNRTTVTVYPLDGAFSPGSATVSVFVGFFDLQAGDLAREDQETVRLVNR